LVNSPGGLAHIIMTGRSRSAKGTPAQAPPPVIADLGKRVRLMEDTQSFGMQLTTTIMKCLEQSQKSAKDVESWKQDASTLCPLSPFSANTKQ
jgi:hypothetical protein